MLGRRKRGKEKVKREVEVDAMKKNINELVRTRNEFVEKMKSEKLEMGEKKNLEKRMRWNAIQERRRRRWEETKAQRLKIQMNIEVLSLQIQEVQATTECIAKQNRLVMLDPSQRYPVA